MTTPATHRAQAVRRCSEPTSIGRSSRALSVVLVVSLLGVSCSGSVTTEANIDSGSLGPSEQIVVVESTSDLFVAESISGHRVVVDWRGPHPQFALPMDRYTLFFFSFFSDVVDVALDQLAEECMAGRGFDFKFPERPVREMESQHLRRYGPIDSSTIASYGYAPVPLSAEQLALIAAATQKLDPTVDQALRGGVGEVLDPTGPNAPCMFVAGSALTGGDSEVGSEFSRVQDAANQSQSLALSLPEVEAALAHWRECLAAKGISAEGTPLDLAASFKRDPSEPPSKTEVETALADLECKRETRLVEEWALAEGNLQLRAYQDDPELFEQSRRGQLSVIGNAVKVTGIELPENALSLLD